MNTTPIDRQKIHRMEYILAGFLRYGAVAACCCIVFGLLLSWLNGGPKQPVPSLNHVQFIAIGVVMLILLPVLRIALTMVIFLTQKDYLFAAIAGLVLFIITTGFLIGVMNIHSTADGLAP